MKKKINWIKVINGFVMISLVTAIPIVAIMMFLSPSVPDPTLPFKRLKTDYILMFLQCIVGIFAMLLPKFLHERISIRIPAGMMLLYAVFLYCSIYLGEVRSFYYHIPHWDTVPKSLLYPLSHFYSHWIYCNSIVRVCSVSSRVF